jgi:pimeloyl-ACP methyl ester carboxylesterase
MRFDLPYGRTILPLVVFGLLCASFPKGSPAQPPPAAGRQAPGEPAANSRDDDKPADPVEIELATDDGFLLKATYYPGPSSEKTAPILMLHEYKGNRNVFRPLALALQEKGHAVLAADLRGHGGSTKFLHPLTGQAGELLAADMKRGDFEAMVRFDVETLRRFLREKNNARELNLNSLCIIGAEMGALVAAIWTANDWSAPPLPGGKQGQDVKALVLLSPPWTFQSIPIRQGLGHPLVRTSVSGLIMAGGRGIDAARDARRVYNDLESYHPRRENPADDDLFFVTQDTSLQGTQLLTAPDLDAAAPILEFIKRRVADPSYPWSARISLSP